MKKTVLIKFVMAVLFIAILSPFYSCLQKINKGNTENDMYDGPDKAAAFEFNRTKDPATGTVPRNRLIKALEYTDSLKKVLPFQLIAGYGNWTERGPSYDAVGASNGNTRANSGIASGRIRAILVDAADATGNTVFIGGVNGGLWKTTDITASPATWTFVNDFFSNMAITSICQNPLSTSTMYFCTGEGFYNGDAVAGDGVFKSTDGGATWAQLANTTLAIYDYCTKILCDAAGNVYLSTRSGLYRSTNGGTTWTDIRPSALSSARVSDFEISSTGRLHISSGIFSTCEYRYTDIPATVTTAVGWTSASGYPASSVRIELGCNGTTLYALPSNGSYQVPTIYKSTNGGANWASTTGQPTAGWASGQAWYALAVDIDGSGNVIVGGLDPYKSTDGGSTWSKLSDWTNNAGLPPTTTQYVHADIHAIKMYGVNRVLFGCDGGIHYSSDGGTTIRDRNRGLRIKQFYSCAIHPSTTNYFLAGAQDNGVHQFNNAGLSNTVEVTGGDGAFVGIDQNNASYQFGSYVYNVYRKSTNGGTTWSTVTYNAGTGQFINPWDYDNTNFKIYAANTTTTYVRWDDPRTGSTFTPVTVSLNSNIVSAVKVSPYTSDLVYMGTDDYNGGAYGGTCRLLKIAAANTATPTVTDIKSGSMPVSSATVSCIAVGSTDQFLMTCFSNYGVQQIWVSTNGGTSWTNIDGNLPDMPVRWCMFVPGDNTKAIIATEAGVYLTLLINGGSTSWLASPTFPTVRTDMLQYRSSDGLVAAATHGRGLWTQPYLSIVPINKFLLKGKWNNNTAELQWEYEGLTPGATLDIEMSTDAANFIKVGSTPYLTGKYYSFKHNPSQQNVFYRIKSTETNGLVKYSNTIKLFKTGNDHNMEIVSIYPNPVQNELVVNFNAEYGHMSYMIHSLSGQAIWRKEEELSFTGAYRKSWNISQLPPGTYLFSIMTADIKRTQQFIKR